MSDPCAFCGSTAPLTREHVLGQWVGKIGLDASPVRHVAGPLNRLGREMGTRPPYQQTVKSFCAACNNGWMSKLESTAQRVLTPLILGEAGTIAVEDQGMIAMWAQKTALTAMLVSSEDDRAYGYGLPPSEYADLYARHHRMQPLDATQFWIGQYDGNPRSGSIRVTPLAVRIQGIPEPELPQAYAVTIVLGRLLLHGLRFTTPALQIDVTMSLGMPHLWPTPTPTPVTWHGGQPCTDEMFLPLADGKQFRSTVPEIELRPWAPATSLPPSNVVDGMIQLPTLCGKHAVYYPAVLADEARCGRFYAFATVCECPSAYMIQTEADGAHCKAADTPETISEIYERMPGEDIRLGDHGGVFMCKRLLSEPRPSVT